MLVKELQPRLFEQFHHILLNSRMSHAYLFSGDFASLEMAVMLAQSRFCKNQEKALPCGHCRYCQLIAEGDFSDVKLIKPTNQIIKTDVIREAMQDFSKSGYESSSQVFIIQDADKMHINAMNSLLKFIEEPNSQSYMILLTNDLNQILPTIRSRCQIFQFPKNRAYLQDYFEKKGLLKHQANLLSELASGITEAKELSKNTRINDLLTAVEKWFSLLVRQPNEAYLWTNRVVNLATDKKEQDWVLQLLVILSRDMNQKMMSYYVPLFLQARQMWQQHVSLQNVLEFILLSKEIQ